MSGGNQGLGWIDLFARANIASADSFPQNPPNRRAGLAEARPVRHGRRDGSARRFRCLDLGLSGWCSLSGKIRVNLLERQVVTDRVLL